MAAVAEKEAKDTKQKNNNSALQELSEEEIQAELEKLTGPRKSGDTSCCTGLSCCQCRSSLHERCRSRTNICGNCRHT